MDMIEDDAR